MLLFAVVAGCQSSENAGDSQTATVTQTTDQAPATQKKASGKAKVPTPNNPQSNKMVD
jgi:hypothetical protein